LVAAGVDAQQWTLVVILALNSAIGLYYYIRIIAVMFEGTGTDRSYKEQLHPSFYIVSGVTMAALALLLVWLGVFPGTVLAIIQQLVS
jgi:NADH-quinone oxidoreductase subunit N